MIFSPHEAKLIAQGKKVTTRRLRKPNERDCRYKEGRAYTIQMRGRRIAEPAKLTIREEPRSEPLGALELAGARKEGYRTTQGFIEAWINQYGSYDAEQEVWVISFISGEHVDRDRYLAQGGSEQRFCPKCKRGLSDDQERCKCGAARPRETPDVHGYTNASHLAMRGEGACIGPERQERYSREARDMPRISERELWLSQLLIIQRSLTDLNEVEENQTVRSERRMFEKQYRRIERRIKQLDLS